jgi:hypothetical protein
VRAFARFLSLLHLRVQFAPYPVQVFNLRLAEVLRVLQPIVLPPGHTLALCLVMNLVSERTGLLVD